MLQDPYFEDSSIHIAKPNCILSAIEDSQTHQK